MKLWMASDYTHGAWYNVEEVKPMAHGRAEAGEILQYYQDDKSTLIAAYYWDNQYCKYRPYNF